MRLKFFAILASEELQTILMYQDLFFESIKQSVCLISKYNADSEHANGFVFKFNTFFKHAFPKINESTIFIEFNDEFKVFALDSFGIQEPKSDLKFSLVYQNRNFLVLKKQIATEQFAFLFNEQKSDKSASSISLVDNVATGNSGEMNFSTSTFDNASSMVVLTDLQGKVEYVNKKFSEITGYTYDEAIGKNTNILKTGKQTTDFYKQMWETILSGQIWSNSFHNKKKSGQLYWQRTQIIPLRDDAGNINRFMALAEDITEGKAIETIMEEKSDLFFQLIEGIPDIVCVKDGDGRWLLANSSNIELFGLEGVNYYGKTSVELTEYSSFYRDALLSCMASDDDAWNTKTLNRKDEVFPLPDGNEIILDTLKIPSFNPDGSRKHLIVIGRDITERKNYVKNIIDAKMKAEESDRLKSTFLATMSHELRTPLNAVIGFSDLILADNNLEPEVNEFVGLIHNNGQQLLGLIEDIFDLSLIESNQIKIYKTKFDLIQVLQDLSEIVPVELRKFNKINDIEFVNKLPDKQIIIDSDASRITQIISNLLKNAIKFTPDGFVKLGIREEESDIVIYVEDNGIGIIEEKQKIIFDIFRQGEETLTRQFGGAGLGLSLSNNLAELLGGKLWVESEVDKGSVFSFRITRPTNGYENTVNQEDTTMLTIDWSDKYVLIAEDEYSNYELLVYILKPTKIRIKHAVNGNQAIDEVLNVERPDLILMDIKMPELNGFEATKNIKEVYPELPIIAQTAFAISGDREMALSMGCDEYISKPIKKVNLLDIMKNYLS